MRRDLLAVVLVLVGIAAAAGAFLLVSRPAHAEITAVTTDKDLYHSHEVMKIAVAVDVSGNADNMTVRIEGIRDTNNRMRLSHQIPVNSTLGPAVLTYDFPLPPCSSCAGLPAGDYPFNVTLFRDGVVISSATHTVRIEQ